MIVQNNLVGSCVSPHKAAQCMQRIHRASLARCMQCCSFHVFLYASGHCTGTVLQANVRWHYMQLSYSTNALDNVTNLWLGM